MKIKIRKAAKKDLPKIKKILKITKFSKNDIKDVENIIKKNGKSFIILLNNKIIGTISGHYHGKKAEIEQIAVLPSYQGRGIGLKLLKEIENSFKENKVEKIYAESVKKKNFGFYIKAGYKKIRNKDFIKEL